MLIKKFLISVTVVAASISLTLVAASCTTTAEDSYTTEATTPAVSTTSTTASATGIVLDPNLTSKSGVPGPEDMKALIALQAQVPYDIIVPTALPAGNYKLVTELMDSFGPTETNPAGTYTFRYADADQADHVLTFNQSQAANSEPPSAYYLTNVSINGAPYQVYWHRSRDYLPQGAPVETESVGDAEAFVVIWQGQYTDATGKPQQLYYSLTTGTWAYDWSEVQTVLQGLKPLKAVGQ